MCVEYNNVELRRNFVDEIVAELLRHRYNWQIHVRTNLPRDNCEDKLTSCVLKNSLSTFNKN